MRLLVLSVLALPLCLVALLAASKDETSSNLVLVGNKLLSKTIPSLSSGLPSSPRARLSSETDDDFPAFDRVHPPDFVPGELIVRFRSNVERARQQSVLSTMSARVEFFHRQFPPASRLQTQAAGQGASSIFDHLALVKLDGRGSLRSAIQGLQKSPEILYVEPNYRLHIYQNASFTIMPNDFEFSKLWGLRNSGQTEGTKGADIDATEAWRLGTGNRNIIVAVVDTGIDYYHPDLTRNLWVNQREIPGNGIDDDQNGYVDDVYGYDFVTDDSDPLDDHNHGTHVSGTIGAVGNNKIGVSGVCWEVRLMAVKAFDELGQGEMSSVIEAIQYSIENGAKVINASWGGSDKSQALEEVINEAHEVGIVFVAAAGNENTDAPSYPAAYSNVVAVAATDRKDARAFFSNFGSYVDLAAPGSEIYSTIPNSSYDFYSGTSMAAPHVAGVTALIMAKHPEFSNDEVVNILRNAVDPIDTDRSIGTGRINAYKALSVEVPLPIAKLDLPDTIVGRIDIRGSAQGNHFASYSLQYGKGSNPTNWLELYSSIVPVEQSILFENLYTPDFEEGLYTVKLTVRDTLGQTAVDRALVRIRNVQITYPMNNDVLRAGEVFSIRGRVFGRNQTYTIEYGVGWQPTVWSSEGITIANTSTEDILDGTLATWETRDLPTNEFYALKLTATSAGKTIGEYVVYMIYLDGQLRPGWPQYLPVTGEFPIDDWRNITVADLDQDGFEELILVDHGNSDGAPARLLVYRYDGRLMWSKELASGLPYSDIPLVGDIDNDGFMEIFVDAGSKGELFAFRWDGTSLPGNWPVHVEATGLGKVLADLDGDGTKELITYSQNSVRKGETDKRQLLVIDRGGNVIRQWELPSCSITIDAPKILPAVGNLDDDPGLEIVAVSGCNQLAVFSLKHPEGPVWTASADGAFLASPVIGDLNHDGREEIIIGAFKGEGFYQGGLYAFNNKGQLLPGWPVLTEESFSSAAALADFRGKGQLEISIASWSSQKLHLVQFNGFEAAGWPIGPLNTSILKSSPVIGDVNNDGIPDIVLASLGQLGNAVRVGDLSAFGGVKAWDHDGLPIDLNIRQEITALVMESAGGSSRLKAAPLTLTDLDHNGKLDIVAASVQDAAYSPVGLPTIRKNRSTIYVWELGAAYAPESMPWPTFQRNLQRTGWYQAPPHVNEAPVVSPIPNQTIPAGKGFFPVELDLYVEDPDHKPEEMSWSVVGNKDLIVVFDGNRIATILTPNETWTGEEIIHFIATDPGGLTSEVSVIFAVKANYDPPVAIADTFTTLEDTPLMMNVLANDIDRGIPLRIAFVSKPRFGKVRIEPGDILSYTPAADFNGTDAFNYTVSDDQGGISMARVTIEVSPVNDPPVAVEDRIITLEDTPVMIDVLANDIDVDKDVLSIIEFSQPTNGSVILTAEKSFLYMPKADFNGQDGFTYKISDGNGTENETSVTVMVKPVNDAPVAQDQGFSINRNLHQDVNFLGTDADGDLLNFKVIKGPEHGDLYAYPAVANYYPMKGFSGTDSFTYTADDGQEKSKIGTVSFTILDQNNAPVANSDSLTTKVGQSLPLTLSGTDDDDDPVTFRIVAEPGRGTLSGSSSNLTYHPNPDFLGNDQFTFQVSDGQSESAEATVSIKVTDINTPPVARDSSVATRANTATNITLQASDAEGNPLKYEVLSNPTNGRLSGDPPELTYTPNPNYTGSDRFTFQVNDGEEPSNLATVSIAVDFPNYPPVATNQSLSLPRDQATAVELQVVDLDGDLLRCPILKGPKNGTLTGQGTNFTYTPKPNFVGTDSFTYKAWDGHIYSNVGKVSITVTPFDEETDTSFEVINHLPNGQMELFLKIAEGKTFNIEASTNLLDWSLVASGITGANPISVVDTNAPSFDFRFYRIRQQDSQPAPLKQ